MDAPLSCRIRSGPIIVWFDVSRCLAVLIHAVEVLVGAWLWNAVSGAIRRLHRARHAAVWSAVVSLTVTLVAAGPGVGPASAAGRPHKGIIWRPRPVVTQSAVTPQAGRARKLARPQHMPGYVPTANAWPTAATRGAPRGAAAEVGGGGRRACRNQ
jgi:hypothetical protein